MKTFLEIFLDFPIFSAALFIGAEAEDSPRAAASDTKSSAFSTGGLAAAIQLERARNQPKGEDPKQRLQRPQIKRHLPRRPPAEDKV